MYRICRDIFHWLNNCRMRLCGWLRCCGVGVSANYRRILSYRGKYAGKRCFLIGNGPSLCTEDLELLRGETCFACNLIYMLYNKTAWRPDFYCVSSFVVVEELFKDITALGAREVFASRSMKKYLHQPDASVIFVDALSKDKYFVRGDMLAYYVPSYATVMSFMIELAMYMGFKEIYLLGVDCTSSFSGEGHFAGGGLSEAQKAAEQATISKTRFARGKTLSEYGDAMLERSVYAYKKLAQYAGENGVKIYNATRGGRLEVFDRVELNEVVQAKVHTDGD